MIVAHGLQFWLDLLALIVAFGAAAIEATDVRGGVDGAAGFGYP